MDKGRIEKIIAIRQKMRDGMNAAMDEAEKEIQQLQSNSEENYQTEPKMFKGEIRQVRYNPEKEYYPRMRSPHIRDRSFPIKISLAEELFLREESRKQNKNMAALIREGYLDKVKAVNNFERLN